jgi:hypothetical protein
MFPKNKADVSGFLSSGCVHWWIIGDHLIGHCKKCGAIRDFEKLQEEQRKYHPRWAKNKHISPRFFQIN